MKRKPPPKKTTKVVAAKAPAAAAVPKAKKRDARLLADEQVRRDNAAARIRGAAEAAGLQKSRMGIFIARLQARLDRSAERIQKLVEEERGRQAKVLEKYPVLKQLNGKPSLDAVAAIPEVKIPESKLPAYITNIHPRETE